jgi:hypothetical protein
LEASSWGHGEQEQVNKVASGELEGEGEKKPWRSALIVCVEEKWFEHTKDDVREVPELTCSHKEVDTRVTFHTWHATTTHKHVIIISEDMDVFVMRLVFSTQILGGQLLSRRAKSESLISPVWRLSLVEMRGLLFGCPCMDWL